MRFFGFCKGLKDLDLPGLKEIEFYHGCFSDFYNNYVTHDFDIQLYLDLVKKHGSRVLELACGSGRVLEPLLQKGVHIDGLDLSEDMLKKAQEKCSGFSYKPQLHCCDMINFASEEPYDIIILAHASLCLIHNQSDRIALFNNVFNNLKPGGLFIFNYFDHPLNSLKDGEKKPIYLFNKKKKSLIMLHEKIDLRENLSIINAYYEETKSEANIIKYISSLSKSILYKSLIEDIIEKTQFVKQTEHIVTTIEGMLRFQVLIKT